MIFANRLGNVQLYMLKKSASVLPGVLLERTGGANVGEGWTDTRVPKSRAVGRSSND